MKIRATVSSEIKITEDGIHCDPDCQHLEDGSDVSYAMGWQGDDGCLLFRAHVGEARVRCPECVAADKAEQVPRYDAQGYPENAKAAYDDWYRVKGQCADLRERIGWIEAGEYADAIDEIEAAEIGDEITVQRCHKELARAVRGKVKT